MTGADGSSSSALATPLRRLSDGESIPSVGFGTASMDDAEAATIVAGALQTGYRFVDTGAKYGNESGVGVGLRNSGIPRGDVVLCSKVRGEDHGYDSTLRACASSMARLSVDYIDLYLIHWPLPRLDKYVETWKALIQLKDEGVVRSIGVSNFLTEHVTRLGDETGVLPAVNQFVVNPRVSQSELRASMDSLGITTIASSPLDRGSGSTVSPPAISELARVHGVTPGQIVLRWGIQVGVIPIPRARNPLHIRQNLDLFSFELTAADIKTINTLYVAEQPDRDPATHEEL